MARVLGDSLPDDLHELLGGHDLAARIGQAILITTTDREQRPHPALVSYGEVVAMDRRRLRLALYRTSGTSGNLRRNGKLTLCLIGPGMAYYVKTSAREQANPMDGFPDLARFEAVVDTVLVDQAREDLEPGARLTAGITFDPGQPVGEVLRGWQAVVDGLRRDA
jgi:hypothetical protein